MHSYLAAVSLGGSQFCQIQWRGSTETHLSVEGFLHWVKEEEGRFISMERQRERAHQALGAYLTGSCGKAHEELAMYTGSFVLYYLLYLML
jgi:hypothetical protein